MIVVVIVVVVVLLISELTPGIPGVLVVMTNTPDDDAATEATRDAMPTICFRRSGNCKGKKHV